MRTGFGLAGLPRKLLALGAARQRLRLVAQPIGFLTKPFFERMALLEATALYHGAAPLVS
ncbi:hypothetical protein XI05_36760 [Bradyrhizobium sp. CCBAU 11357]|nr:hypothetical protein [Bradyrhizobium sp. CCBAU 11357]